MFVIKCLCLGDRIHRSAFAFFADVMDTYIYICMYIYLYTSVSSTYIIESLECQKSFWHISPSVSDVRCHFQPMAGRFGSAAGGPPVFGGGTDAQYRGRDCHELPLEGNKNRALASQPILAVQESGSTANSAFEPEVGAKCKASWINLSLQ